MSLTNQIKATECTNSLIWTALVFDGGSSNSTGSKAAILAAHQSAFTLLQPIHIDFTPGLCRRYRIVAGRDVHFPICDNR